MGFPRFTSSPRPQWGPTAPSSGVRARRGRGCGHRRPCGASHWPWPGHRHPLGTLCLSDQPPPLPRLALQPLPTPPPDSFPAVSRVQEGPLLPEPTHLKLPDSQVKLRAPSHIRISHQRLMLRVSVSHGTETRWSHNVCMFT